MLISEERPSTQEEPKQEQPEHEEPKDVRQPTITIERAEPTYYSDEKGVRITPTRFIYGSTTYSMANITSVKVERTGPNRTVGIVLTIFGAVILIISGVFEVWPVAIIGMGMLAGGIAAMVAAKPKYHLRITSAAGESEPIKDKDEKYINQVAMAVNEALIKRG